MTLRESLLQHCKSVARVREGVVRDLAAKGFNIQQLKPRSFESVFGLDAEIGEVGEVGALKEMMARGEGPYGDAGEPVEMTREVAAKILAALKPQVDEIEYARYERLFRNLVDAASAGETQAADMPPEFPGRPTPGGKMVPLDKRSAMDSSFDKMFPGAPREVADPHDHSRRHAPKPRDQAAVKTAKGASFAEMYPGADRIGRVT